MELRKQRELNPDPADKSQLERNEQIVQRLEQLADAEREYRELLEQEGRRKMKLYVMRSTSDSSSDVIKL